MRLRNQTIYFRGSRIAFNHAHDIAGIVETHVLDVYHSEKIVIGSLVLDFGAGIGDFTVLASKQVGPKGLVVSIEPSPADFSTLLSNIELNSLANVIPVNVAVGSASGSEVLRFKGRTVSAKTRNLYAILEDNNIDVYDFNAVFIKMDIEGFETGTLMDIGDLLLKCDTIAIELHGTRSKVDCILLPMGFTFVRFNSKRGLLKSLKFLLSNPIASLTLLWYLILGHELPTPRKLLKGIDIASSPDLMVGIYTRGG